MTGSFISAEKRLIGKAVEPNDCVSVEGVYFLSNCNLQCDAWKFEYRTRGSETGEGER